MSFSDKNIKIAKREAERFLRMITNIEKGNFRYGKEVAATRRASSDLSAALVELRRSVGYEEYLSDNIFYQNRK